MNKKTLILGIIIALALCAAVVVVIVWNESQKDEASQDVVSNTTTSTSSNTSVTLPEARDNIPDEEQEVPETTEEPEPAMLKDFITEDLEGAPSVFSFAAKIPGGWQVNVISEIASINFLDPSAEGASNLEKSQIFIRSFEANTFLTLTTVNILERTETTIAGRPAVRYVIEKKPTAANFPNQPVWRNTKHVVTDVRVSDTNPSVFYVIAKNPSLSEEVYQDFLSSLKLN